MKMWFAISAAILSITAFAGPQGLDCQQTSPLEQNLKELTDALDRCKKNPVPEPTPAELNTLCIQLTTNSTDQKTGVKEYLLSLHKISCASLENQDENTLMKIRSMWKNNAHKIQCNINGYNLPGYNILKYAVRIPDKDFFEDIINTYEIDVNFKDEKDGKTVLEFCHEEIKRYQNMPNISKNHVDQVKEVCAVIASSKVK